MDTLYRLIAAILLVLPSLSLPAEPSWGDVFHKRVPFAQGWKYIVIHHSATEQGSAASFHRYHLQRGWGGLSYHFVIGNGNGADDGEVQQGFRWRQQISGTHISVRAWYYNLFGIGICLVGNFQEGRPTPAQLDSLVTLVRRLMRQHKIPLQNVLGHGMVRRGFLDWDDRRIMWQPTARREPRSCPGRLFPWDEFRRRLAAPGS